MHPGTVDRTPGKVTNEHWEKMDPAIRQQISHDRRAGFR